MPDRDKTVSRLQIIRTWAEVGKTSDGIQGEGCLRDVVNWIDDALELMKEQEPRVLTLEEVEDALDTVVWVDRPQIRNSSLEFALLASYSSKREKTALYFIDGEKTTWRYSDYGRTWRCWSSRPTDEQRESVKWDGT